MIMAALVRHNGITRAICFAAEPWRRKGNNMTCSIDFANRRIAPCVLLTLLAASSLSLGQDKSKSEASPSALAQESFDAFKRGDTAKYVSFFHPNELKRLQAFVVELFKSRESDQEPDKDIEQLRKLFAPFDSVEKATAAKGTDLLAAFLKNTVTNNPDFGAILASAKLQILGEIVEGEDKVHVITRTVLPRPQPTSCQKQDGDWRLLLNSETLQMMEAFERKSLYKRKGWTQAEIAQKTKIDQVEVVGHVMDGEVTAQVLCRVKMKTDDIGYSLFACYPVREGEPAWDHLGDKDRTKLAEALLSKWKK